MIEQLPDDKLALRVANEALEVACNGYDEITAMSERLRRIEIELGLVD